MDALFLPAVLLAAFVLFSLAVGTATGLLRSLARPRVAALLATAGLVLAVTATLVRPREYPPAGWWPWEVWEVAVYGSLSPAHPRVAANALMLVPFAFFGALASRRPLPAAGAGVALTCVVEYVQGAAGVGTTQLSDLIYNTAGALAGAAVAWLLLRSRSASAVSPTSGAAAGSAG